MKKSISFARKHLRLFAALGVLFIPATGLRAEDSLLHSASEKSKALVTLQSVNATVLAGKPQGIFDKATGRILILKRIRPVGHARAGSGIIIDPRGIIVTNAHTVRGAGAVSVTFFDGSQAPAKQVSVVPHSDIAFISVRPPFPLASIALADSDAVSRGTEIYFIGSSAMLKGSLVGGKISGIVMEKGSSPPHTALLQISPGAYQGDSGSAVLDRNGNLLGMISLGLPGRRNGTFAATSNDIGAAYRSFLKEFKPD